MATKRTTRKAVTRPNVRAQRRAQRQREIAGIRKFLAQVERLGEVNGTLWAERMSAYYKRRLAQLVATLSDL